MYIIYICVSVSSVGDWKAFSFVCMRVLEYFCVHDVCVRLCVS